MSKYYFRISVEGSMAETELPSSSTSDERRNYMYLYDDGHVRRIDHPQNAFDGLERYDIMSFRVRQLQEMPHSPTIFRTCDLREPPADPADKWQVLGFDRTSEGQFKRYQLGHGWGDDRAFEDMVANPWLWLLSGTEHLDLTGSGGDNARCLLSGRLAMFWGLVALSFGGRDLDTLNLNVQGNQFNIDWPRREPHRIPNQLITIEIYYDRNTSSLEAIEASWRLA